MGQRNSVFESSDADLRPKRYCDPQGQGRGGGVGMGSIAVGGVRQNAFHDPEQVGFV